MFQLLVHCSFKKFCKGGSTAVRRWRHTYTIPMIPADRRVTAAARFPIVSRSMSSAKIRAGMSCTTNAEAMALITVEKDLGLPQSD